MPGAGRMLVDVPQTGPVRLEVFDIIGRLVSTLLDDQVEKGRGDVAFADRASDGRPLPNGVYFLRLTTRAGVATAKVQISR
jgi:hypothetical protein